MLMGPYVQIYAAYHPTDPAMRASGLELSPATIRNVMADLEDMGMLAHPHTSAGRLPTDAGQAGLTLGSARQ